MNVNARLLSREEEQTKWAITNDSWCHALTLAYSRGEYTRNPVAYERNTG
jgi:hypothetical protein